MLTKLIIRNLKRFEDVEIELGNPVVFIGPNDSGKTTALQALALWDVGLKRWNEKRKGMSAPEKRSGVAINRRDLSSIPVPDAKLLWRNLHVRDVKRSGGRRETSNIRIDIIVEGVTIGKAWSCGLEFDYANEESFHCRPLRLSEGKNPDRMRVPDEADGVNLSFLPPMSGLSDREFAKQTGEINFLIGQGLTAEVLRNLCYQLSSAEDNGERWTKVRQGIEGLFGVSLDMPKFIPERSEIILTYRDLQGVRLDLSSGGRGLHQTLLLLSFLALNPTSVLLLDEPDAHLEILRQQQIYQLLTEAALAQDSQIIAASHSEKLLNEAASRDVVIAFLGQPHRIDDRGSQLLKSLKEIGYDQYYQAEQKGWVLYVEGSTDLAILRAFADKLNHAVGEHLERPFVHYIQNQPSKARDHFHGLREAKQDLVGFMLCDRSESITLQDTPELRECMWLRREIENYLCQPETLVTYAADVARTGIANTLFETPLVGQARSLMEECIEDLVPRMALRDLADRWWTDTKASDEFLDRLFHLFFKKMKLPNLMSKTNYHILARHVPHDLLEPEITQVLDGIQQTARRANPRL